MRATPLTRALAAVVSVGIIAFAAAFAEDSTVPRKENLKRSSQSPTDTEAGAIRTQSQAFIDAFNQRDAKAVAALWTEDGEYIDDTGRRFAGRTEIEKGYANLFASNPNVTIKIAIDSIRVLSQGAATEEGSAVIEPSPMGVSGISRYSAIHVKVDEKWLMASVRDTWVETPPAARSAADLKWMIGTWVAEEHGVQTESICRWSANERFLERRYTTTKLDGTKTTGLQLIGWNPLGQHVQSWDFSPDGGHSMGIWTATDGGWQSQVQGTTGHGIPTAAVNVLIRLDDNAYMWQSTQRTVGESAIPDTDEIVIKRSKPDSPQPVSPKK